MCLMALKEVLDMYKKKLSLIRKAFSNGAVDKPLAKLFIKKSTITIRRELAESFAVSQNSINQCNYYAKEIENTAKEFFENNSIDLKQYRANIRSHYRLFLRYLLENIEIERIDIDDVVNLTHEEIKNYLSNTKVVFEEHSKLAQSGLIYISEEKDYNVQDNVVRYITKENSVWVLPNIQNHYHKRIINEKIIGE